MTNYSKLGTILHIELGYYIEIKRQLNFINLNKANKFIYSLAILRAYVIH